jgi:acyl dehydratase
MPALVSALKRVDLPTLGRPTMPHFRAMLLVQATMQHTGFAFLNMELDIKGPTFVNDTIHVECEVMECRESGKRPGMGLVRTRNRVVKQDGTEVLVYTPLRMVKGRSLKKG